VLRRVAKGMAYREIADELFVSHRTVQNHVQNVLRKAQLHNRVELTLYAIEQGYSARRTSSRCAGAADHFEGSRHAGAGGMPEHVKARRSLTADHHRPGQAPEKRPGMTRGRNGRASWCRTVA